MTLTSGMTLKARLARGDALAVAWVGLTEPLVAELLARQGFDVLCFDMQHGLVTAGDLPGLLQAAQQTEVGTLVRVPGHDPAVMMRALDLGADGVIVPLVDNAEQAAAAVSACRYPPLGTRSYGPLRAALRRGPGYAARADDEVVVLAMIETRGGLTNLDAICATPGLSGVFIGPSDLGYALGLGPQLDSDHPEHRAAVTRIVSACQERGLTAGLYCNDPVYARRAAEEGVQLLVLGGDVRMLAAQAQARLEVWRG